MNSFQEWISGVWDEIVTFFTFKEDGEMNNLERCIAVIVTILVAFLVIKLITFILKRALGIHKKGPQIDISAKSFIVQFVKIILWISVAFICTSIIGLDVTGLAGVLSAVTVALGLALQDAISCFASGIMILSMHTFKTGDYLSISNGYGTVEGTVIKIGLMITTLKTVGGQHVFVSNNNVIKSNTTDFSSNDTRRASFVVPIPTDADTVLATKLIKEVLEADSRILKDPSPIIHVDTIEDYCINMGIKFYTKTGEYWDVYNFIREPIIIKFRENGIYIPTRNKVTVINND